MQKKGPNTYIVRVPGNNKRFVHADHLMHRDVDREQESEVRHELVTDLPPGSGVVVPTEVPVSEPTAREEDNVEKPVVREPVVTASESDCNTEGSDITVSNSDVLLRRSSRVRKAPDRYGW